MEKIINLEKDTTTDNSFIANKEKVVMTNSEITFFGEKNIVFLEDGCSLLNTKINIQGDGNLVYISKSRHKIIINVSVFNNSTLYLGPNAYFNGTLNVSLSEEKNFLVGEGCLFSFGIWGRTADPHLIYDMDSKVRINPSKSIMIGDHVWIGQSAMLLKGCQVGSGSIIGAGAILSKITGTNEIWGGNPAKKIKENIFWSPESVHAFTDLQTKKYNVMNKKEFIFSRDIKLALFKQYDALFASNKDKLEFIKSHFNNVSGL